MVKAHFLAFSFFPKPICFSFVKLQTKLEILLMYLTGIPSPRLPAVHKPLQVFLLQSHKCYPQCRVQWETIILHFSGPTMPRDTHSDPQAPFVGYSTSSGKPVASRH